MVARTIGLDHSSIALSKRYSCCKDSAKFFNMMTEGSYHCVQKCLFTQNFIGCKCGVPESGVLVLLVWLVCDLVA